MITVHLPAFRPSKREHQERRDMGGRPQHIPNPPSCRAGRPPRPSQPSQLGDTVPSGASQPALQPQLCLLPARQASDLTSEALLFSSVKRTSPPELTGTSTETAAHRGGLGPPRVLLLLSELSRRGSLAPHHRCRGAARREAPRSHSVSRGAGSRTTVCSFQPQVSED